MDADDYIENLMKRCGDNYNGSWATNQCRGFYFTKKYSHAM